MEGLPCTQYLEYEHKLRVTLYGNVDFMKEIFGILSAVIQSDRNKPLKDFIYESNKGNHFFFVSGREEGIEKLENAR